MLSLSLHTYCVLYIYIILHSHIYFWRCRRHQDADVNSIKHYPSIVSCCKTLAFVSRGTAYSLITGCSTGLHTLRGGTCAWQEKIKRSPWFIRDRLAPRPVRLLAEILSSDSCVSPILPADLTMSWRRIAAHEVKETPSCKCKYIYAMAHDYCAASHIIGYL